MTHGTGRWESGIRLAGIEKLSQSSVTDNSIHGAATGISYVGNDTDTPKDIPTVAGNRISGQTIAAAKLPTPTCIGGNLGDIAQFTGAGKPNFVAPKGSTYINRDGIFGSDDLDKAPRYLSDGTMHWHPIANG